LLLLLGAGFSNWAADLPIARQLFDFAIEPFGPKEERLLARIRATKANWDTSHPGKQAEQFIAHAVAAGGAYRDLVLWYVQRRLVAPFIFQEGHVGRIRRHVLQIDERSRAKGRPGIVETAKFLELARPDGIITLNYDMLVEYALGARGFHYGAPNQVLSGRGPYPVSQFINPVQLRGTLPLLKLHGSISWDERGEFADGRRGLSGRALIVAPVPEKIPPPELAHVWRAARSLLRATTRIVAFGVAFNPYDEAVLALLGEAHPDAALLIDPYPKTAAAQRVWPSARIVAIPPPPDGDGAIREWLHGAGA
jgi:hypothetical protein